MQIADKQHIATTDVNKSLATKIRKYKRVKQTIKLFLEHGGLISDIELANILKAEGIDTSSSTVGRDLTGDMAKEILTEEQYNNIVLLRASNLLKGKQKGGQNYALNNTYQKDEHGKFTGSKRNGR